MNLDFDEVFDIVVYAMKINLSHPFIRKNWHWFIRIIPALFLLTLMAFFLLYSMVMHDMRAKNLDDCCSNAIISCAIGMVIFQYAVAIIHKEQLEINMRDMIRDYAVAQTLPPHERKIVETYAAQGRFASRLWALASAVTSILFPLKSIIMMGFYTLTDHFKLVHIYDTVTYVEPIEDKKDNIVIFSFLWIIYGLFAAYAGLMYTAIIPIGPIFMLHASGQLELLRSRLKILFADVTYNEATVVLKLNQIVHHLQYVYNFVERLKNSLQILYEISLKVTLVAVAVCAFEVLQTLKKGEYKIEFLTLVITGIIFCFVPCYFGDVLMEKGEDFRLSVYTCGWENHWNKRARSTILLILTKAVRPIAVRSVFSTICLDTFSNVMRQCYSLFNLLMASKAT